MSDPKDLNTDSHASTEQRAFEHIGQISKAGNIGQRWIDRVFKPLFSGFETLPNDWVNDADLEMQRQRELRARGILYTIIITLVLLLIWAAFASLDQVTRGDGKIIPSTQLQVIQSLDGGMLQEILVQEGERVSKGQLLVRIDPTRSNASYQEGQVQTFALQAKVDRLRALIEDQPYQPASEQALSPDQHKVLEQELGFYQESRNELKQQLYIATQQLEQKQRELDEAQAALRTARQAYAMASRELNVTKPLLRSGAVSSMDILRLEREVAGANGDRHQADARVKQVQASIEEARAHIEEVGHRARNEWRSELSDATAKLDSLKKNAIGLKDKVNSSELRSPVNGTVQRLFFNTLGGVVQPGRAVMEIVPSDDRLLVEAKVAPKDIAFLRPGLPAMVKLYAYDFSIYGGMDATVTHISPDTITDDKGNTYSLVRARTNSSNFT